MPRTDRGTSEQRIRRFAMSGGSCEICGDDSGKLYMTRTNIYKDHQDCELEDYRMMCTMCRSRTTSKQRGQKNREAKERKTKNNKLYFNLLHKSNRRG